MNEVPNSVESQASMLEKLFPGNRSQKRAQEKHIVKNLKREHNARVHRVKKIVETINLHFKSYTNSYNEFIKDNGSPKGINQIVVDWAIDITYVKEEELMSNITNPQMELLLAARVPEGKTRIAYLRADVTYYIDKNAPKPTVRPEIPEKLEEDDPDYYRLTQLLYHAIYPLIDEEAQTVEIAREHLLLDFQTHMFCCGLDMQNINNNREWSKRLTSQHDNLQEKVDEVTEMFSKIGEQNEQQEQHLHISK